MEMWPARASITNPANADIVSMMAFDIELHVMLLVPVFQCKIILPSLAYHDHGIR